MIKNPLTATDFYKTTHYQQLAPGTSKIYSNLTPRGDKLKNVPDELWTGKVTWFGLQYFLKEFLWETWVGGFFSMPKEWVLDDYSRRMNTSLGEGTVTADHIGALHDLGYLPICIRALPEGTQVPMRVPVLTIENTHEDFAWLTNWFETALSTYTWKMSTAATVAHHYRLLVDRFAEETCDSSDHARFQCHDFAMRGLSGLEDAAMTGAAHLTAFCGTDTIPAIDLLEDYYNADPTKELIGTSVRASEHSIACSNILHIVEQEGVSNLKAEEIFIRRILTEVYPGGIVSLVSDSYDFWGVVEECLPALKDMILSRDGVLSIRPDSGTPEDILCGKEISRHATLKKAENWCWDDIRDELSYDDDAVEAYTNRYVFVEDEQRYYKLSYYVHFNRQTDVFDSLHYEGAKPYEPSPEDLGLVECLWNTFGGTTNSKGFKVLDPHISCIYGDSITLDRAHTILKRLKAKGFASSNVYLGVGSFTYQHVTRDTFGWAVKCTYAEIDGRPLAVYKDPKTDSGTKKSARGRLKVVKGEDGELKLVDGIGKWDYEGDEMRTVFLDGELIVDDTLAAIRERSRGV